MPKGEQQGRWTLDELIIKAAYRPTKRLAKKHKKRARAEAAERTRRLAFDPGEEADKVRRYEDIAVRRMTRTLDELTKLRRSELLDDDSTEWADGGSNEPCNRDESRLQAVCVEPAQAGTPTSGPPPSADLSPRGQAEAKPEFPLESRLRAVSVGPAQAGIPTPTPRPSLSVGPRAHGEEALVPPISRPPAQRSSPAGHDSRTTAHTASGLLHLLLLVFCLWWLAGNGWGVEKRSQAGAGGNAAYSGNRINSVLHRISLPQPRETKPTRFDSVSRSDRRNPRWPFLNVAPISRSAPY